MNLIQTDAIRKGICVNISNRKNGLPLKDIIIEDLYPILVDNECAHDFSVPLYSHLPITLSRLLKLRESYMINHSRFEWFYFDAIKNINRGIVKWLLHLFENSNTIKQTIIDYIIDVDKLGNNEDRIVDISKELKRLITREFTIERLFIKRIDLKIKREGYKNLINSNDEEFENNMLLHIEESLLMKRMQVKKLLDDIQTIEKELTE